MDIGNRHKKHKHIPHTDDSRKNLLAQTYLASSTTSTSVRAAICVLEGAPVGSSVFNSPLVELTT